jgi:hypothetical protein
MAHGFATEWDVTPWEALLKAVRIAAGRVAYCEWVLGTAVSDLEIEGRVRDGSGDALVVHPDTGEALGVGSLRDLTFWREQSEIWIDRMARYSKLAIDAGVAAAMVERERVAADKIVSVFSGMLNGLLDAGLSPEMEITARRLLREQLLALDQQEHRALTAIAAEYDMDGPPVG